MKNTIRKVPPAPQVMASLFAQYKKARLNISFKKYLESIGFVDPALSIVGMDDTAHHSTALAAGPELNQCSVSQGFGRVARESITGGFFG